MVEWTTACPDWERRIVRRESLIPFPPLFPDEANAALEVYRALHAVDVALSPPLGEVSRPWSIDFVGAVFGAYDHSTGRRLIREFFELISKKNGKSTKAAGIMLTALIRNWRRSAEFVILAPTKEIANNSFIPARDMVRADAELDELLHVQEHYRSITHRQTKATLRIVAADNETVGGKKTTGLLVEELWLFGKRANAEGMLREAAGGLASRPEGFVIYLTTQSDEPPAGVFKQKLDYARGVRDGRIADKRFLPVLYEYPQGMLDQGRHRDKANFYVTNPNLGASVDEEFLQREFDKAIEAGEASLRGFLAKHLNVEIGLALRSDRWAGADHWEAAAEALTLEELIERCEVLVAGIDGGGLDDLLGLGVIGREKVTRRWLHWGHAWAHGSVLERRKDIAPKLEDLARAGELTIVGVPGQDVADVADLVEQLEQSGKLAEEHAIGVDPVGIAQIVDEIVARGIAPERIVGISQGWKLSGAIKTAERGLADGTLVHAAQALMAWAVGNAKVEPRGNAITITKQTAGSAKIDPLMALFNAVALMAMNPQSTESVYDQLAAADATESEELAAEGESLQSEAEDLKILRDPAHPRWQEARERFEARLSQTDDDL
jgi:phage terminase large subunit-like protein